MTEPKFKVGDHVQLISGGPNMTINKVVYVFDYNLNQTTDKFSGEYQCVWFEGDDENNPHYRTFKQEVLKPFID